MSDHGAVKLQGVVKVACTMAVLQAGRTELETPFANEDTSVPTPMKMTPFSVIFLAAAMKLVLFFSRVALGIKRPPYWAMPTWIFPYGNGPKYLS